MYFVHDKLNIIVTANHVWKNAFNYIALSAVRWATESRACASAPKLRQRIVFGVLFRLRVWFRMRVQLKPQAYLEAKL